MITRSKARAKNINVGQIPTTETGTNTSSTQQQQTGTADNIAEIVDLVPIVQIEALNTENIHNDNVLVEIDSVPFVDNDNAETSSRDKQQQQLSDDDLDVLLSKTETPSRDKQQQQQQQQLSDDDLDVLLSKAETLSRDKQQQQQSSDDDLDVLFPRLDAGISKKDHSYIRTHTGGIVSLRRPQNDGNVIVQDKESAKLRNGPQKNDRNDPPNQLTRKQKKELREATTGPGWFDMPKPELTPELKRDLQVVKLRNVLDPKHFYKKEDSKQFPKYFQVGTIIEGPTEFYSSRLPRKQRKQTIVEELMANEEAKSYYKRKFLEIQETKQSGGKKHYNNLKKRRKPNWEKNF
ncbi:7625_t:CDS:2 [Ambispora gerdemannii]|uniref:7625_t:CDS:1 n=1 Tax=Ambispora gerdemannii TaxID=144530 RepID=A0A9N8YNZ1_9GLOM|nr:7625_t:CDS:2 [Ambispora gerdemannii]